MKKFFTLCAAALVVVSASALDLSKLKKFSAKNLEVQKFERFTTSSIRKASAASATAPFAERYNATGFKYDFDAPEEEDPWVEASPWVVYPATFDDKGETVYGICNIIPNEDMWVEDPILEYVYDAENGQLIVPCTPLSYYDEETIIYIMDIYDFGQGGSGNICFTLDKDGNLARPTDVFSHAVAWTVAYFDPETYEPTDILGYFGVYAAMTYNNGSTTLDKVTTDVKVTKTIKNGQIVINKNGQSYNILGVKL